MSENPRTNQIAAALLIVAVFGAGIFLIRWRFSSNEDSGRSAIPVQRQPLPASGNAIDVGDSPMPADDDDGDGYSEVVSGSRYFTKDDDAAGDASDEPLTEEECKAFTSHLETLEIRKDPAAASAFRDPKAVSALSDMCAKKQLSPKFARCAMSKKSTKDFMSCGGSEMEKSMKEAQAVIADLEKP